MIITEKQLLCLIEILKDTLPFCGSNSFDITQKQRYELYSTIINQQSDKLIDIKDNKCL